MAEEQDILAELEEGEAEGGKGKSPLKLIIMVVLVLALGGGGYFAYLNFFQQAAEEVTEEGPAGPAGEGNKVDSQSQAVASGSPAAAPQQEAIGVMVPLKPFIVNLAGSGGKRFLKVTMTLELNGPGTRPEYNDNTERIIDSVLVLLSSKTFEEVYSVQGKFKLKDEITTRVNRFLLVGHVKDVYFTEFVIQ